MYLNIVAKHSVDYVLTVANVAAIRSMRVVVSNLEELRDFVGLSGEWHGLLGLEGESSLGWDFPCSILRLDIERNCSSEPRVIFTDGAAYLCGDTGATLNKY